MTYLWIFLILAFVPGAAEIALGLGFLLLCVVLFLSPVVLLLGVGVLAGWDKSLLIIGLIIALALYGYFSEKWKRWIKEVEENSNASGSQKVLTALGFGLRKIASKMRYFSFALFYFLAILGISTWILSKFNLLDPFNQSIPDYIANLLILAVVFASWFFGKKLAANNFKKKDG